MRKLFTLTTVASGAAIGILIVGVLAIVAGIYTRDVVHDQLAPQKIYFPEKGDELPPELNQYAGQQVDTGTRGQGLRRRLHRRPPGGIGAGKSYSEVSSEFMKDPNNKELAQQRQTMFMGETCAGCFSTHGAGGRSRRSPGVVLILVWAVLLAIPLLAAREAKREASATEPVSVEPGVPAPA